MPLLSNEQSDWSGGVITNERPDNLPPGAYPRGRNVQLLNVGGGQAAVGTRPGLVMMNSTKSTGGGTVLRQMQYRPYSAGAFTTYHLVVTSAGKLKVMNDSTGALTDADAGNVTPFTTGENYPDYHVANNQMYIVNGKENWKFNGTALQAFGVTSLSTGLSAIDSGVAGNPNGTYEFALTYYNSVTGQEGSLTAQTAATVANKKITVSWTAPVDTQVTTVRVHVRKGTLSGSFFRVTAGTTPAVDANGGFPVATTSMTFDATDAQLNGFIILSPTLTENNPPPVLDRLEYHQGRLFGVAPSDPSVLLFGKLSSEGVESFNPQFAIPINTKDGDRITALKSANEQLIIFKTHAIYILVGTYPDWQLRVVTNELGCTSHLSVYGLNNATYFWSEQGPAVFASTSPPKLLAQPSQANLVDLSALNFTILSKIAVGFDPLALRLLWSLPDASATRNSFLLPFNLRTGSFEADRWDSIDTASMAHVIDGNGKPLLYFGDYNGRVFKLDAATFVDGVPSGTVTGTGVTTSYTSTTLTDTSAAFFTTGDGLAQLYVYLRDMNGNNVQRKRIGSNTATTITLDGGLTWDALPDKSWKYVVGGPDFEFDYGWNNLQAAFVKKRFEFFYLDFVPPSAGTTTLYVDYFTEFNVQQDTTRSLTTDVPGAVWDSSKWDSSLFGGGAPLVHKRLRVQLSARSLLTRIRCGDASRPIVLVRLGLRAQSQSDKD